MPSTLAPVIPIPAPATPDENLAALASKLGFTVPQMSEILAMRAALDATWAASQR